MDSNALAFLIGLIVFMLTMLVGAIISWEGDDDLVAYVISLPLGCIFMIITFILLGA